MARNVWQGTTGKQVCAGLETQGTHLLMPADSHTRFCAANREPDAVAAVTKSESNASLAAASPPFTINVVRSGWDTADALQTQSIKIKASATNEPLIIRDRDRNEQTINGRDYSGQMPEMHYEHFCVSYNACVVTPTPPLPTHTHTHTHTQPYEQYAQCMFLYLRQRMSG